MTGASTRLAMRLRWPIVAAWLAVMVVGFWASGRLSSLQSNVFTVPGTDAEHVRSVLQHSFGDRSDGAFTVVFRVGDSADPAVRARLQRVLDRGARAIPSGRGTAAAAGRATRAVRQRHLHARPGAARRGNRRPRPRDRAAGRHAGVCHRRPGDPARPRPDLQPGPGEGRVDRPADRARRPAARLRPLAGRC